MQEFSEDEFLAISGIQHYAFCPRQWALIHIENIWEENYLTATGRVLHNKAHDMNQTEKRGNTIIVRALNISSRTLGIFGECDVVEFHFDKNGINLFNFDGKYTPYPIEYKRGKPKVDECDRLQLCAQAMCLEEMLNCQVQEGAIFYGQLKHRETVTLDQYLKEKVRLISEEMHNLFKRQYIPQSKSGKHCISCSLKDICLPRLSNNKSAQKYIEDNLA
jgi:CRISPR-associated exonuclease Cas4